MFTFFGHAGCVAAGDDDDDSAPVTPRVGDFWHFAPFGKDGGVDGVLCDVSLPRVFAFNFH